MNEAGAKLKALLEVEKIDTDLFRSTPLPENPGRVFGGQVVAQALAAATGSIDDERPAHSLHAYFMRPGDTTRPIIYRVLRDFDGGSFANRRVVAMQGGKPILNLAASFHKREDGFSHAAVMPKVPMPEECADLVPALKARGQKLPEAILERLGAFEVNVVPPIVEAGELPRQYLWFRLSSPMEASDALNRILLTFVSDFALISTAILPHAQNFSMTDLQVASLDHAVWFHSTPKVDDWILYAMDSPWSGHARGFARGSFYDRAGNLIASVSQEGLCRLGPSNKSA